MARGCCCVLREQNRSCASTLNLNRRKSWRCFLNKAANTYWTDSRLAAQRPTARPLTLATPARELSREIVGTRAEVRRRGGLIPSWAVFTMIMLATFALCVSVTMRTHAEMRSAEQKLSQMHTEVQALSNTN